MEINYKCQWFKITMLSHDNTKIKALISFVLNLAYKKNNEIINNKYKKRHCFIIELIILLINVNDITFYKTKLAHFNLSTQ